MAGATKGDQALAFLKVARKMAPEAIHDACNVWLFELRKGSRRRSCRFVRRAIRELRARAARRLKR